MPRYERPGVSPFTPAGELDVVVPSPIDPHTLVVRPGLGPVEQGTLIGEAAWSSAPPALCANCGHYLEPQRERCPRCGQ